MIDTEESLEAGRRLLRTLSLAGASGVLALGTLVIIGWHAESQRLVQIHSQFAPMQYNTALGFILCGAGLMLLNLAIPRGAAIAGGIAAVLGGLTLSQDVVGLFVPGFGLGIDELLMKDTLVINTPDPGRMAPNTAICFLLTGTCIALRPTRAGSPARSCLMALQASTALGLGVVAMSGYFTRLPAAYGWGNWTQMAVHASVAFVILSTGLLLLQWARDIDRETWIPRWMPATLAVACLTATLCFWQALTAEGLLIQQKIPDIRNYTRVTNLATLMLIMGTVLAITLALAAHLSQKSYARAWQLDKTNLYLWAEIETRKKAEQELAAHRDQLEQAVAQRTRELEMARQDAEAANRAKSEFLSHMSHELRTPLNGILGYAQILQRNRRLADDERQQLGAIVSCGDHLLSLINDVLDLSKIEAQKVEVDLAPLELAKLVQGVANILQEKAEQKGLDLVVHIDPSLPTGIVSDAAKLRQILINLLGNAVKFTRQGSVKLHARESPAETLRLDVIDTGIGMSSDEVAQVFDPFKQVEAGKAAGGTGLGLAITKNLAELLGAAVEVDSSPGKGSTFSVSLPLVVAPPGSWASGSDVGEMLAGPLVLSPGQSCTILIADDRDLNRHVVCDMLRPLGFQMLEATDGNEAIECMRAHPEIDLVLMDVRMPRVSGLEAIERIRQDEQLNAAKVIAVTASVYPEFRRRALSAGFDDFLGKPLRLAQLMTKLTRHLDLELVHPTPPGDEGPGPSTGVAPDRLEPQHDVLPADQLQRLRDALKIKNVTAITAIAGQLESVAQLAPLAQRIRTLARQFNFEHLAALLERMEPHNGTG